jgi:CRISPR-associated protein Cmr2
VLEKISRLTGENKGHLPALFQRQSENYWDLQWSSVKLVEKQDIEEATSLLPERAMDEPVRVFHSFGALVRKKWNVEMDARGLLYAPTHQLAQTALAAGKARKTINRPKEPGQKCRLCAEFEALHKLPYESDISAHEYKNHIDVFWKTFADAWGIETDFDDGEKLCALCLTKRISYRILKDKKAHILHACFDDAESFPSTTEMALYEEFNRRGITDKRQKQQRAQHIHDNEAGNEIENPDRYYAILVMDGDHMGKLINGETIGSTWGSAMHPEMNRRLQKSSFEAIYRETWAPILKGNCKRLITPAIHAAISESLGDFSIRGVSEIVNRHGGRLIYAGGDDVCAVMPVSTVVKAAMEISRYYNAEFKLVTSEGPLSVKGKWKPSPGKLSISLGRNEENNEDRISISAGILVCHHKEALSQMITRAHILLENQAKEIAGRNACAIELRKRSGGSRYFVRRWSDSKAWDSFEQVGRWIKDKNKSKVSKSFAYRLEQFRDGVAAILREENHRELMRKFVAAQLERSGLKTSKGQKMVLAAGITEIILDQDENQNLIFRPEGLIVAAFIADTESEVQ